MSLNEYLTVAFYTISATITFLTPFAMIAFGATQEDIFMVFSGYLILVFYLVVALFMMKV